MVRRLPLALALALGLLFVTSAASAEVLTFEGEVPASGPDHFFIPFDVPEGVAEIEVRHDDRSDVNVLDWGLDDPSGYRGWGGGTSEPAVVNAAAASRAYVRGPIVAGKWRVVVGKARVVASPATYVVEVELRTTATLPPQTDRKPYVASAALETNRRWYAGDFHVHSYESTDARPPLDEVAAFARSRGLDFVEISDHNTVTQLDYFTDVQARHPQLLLVPGIEYTTYAGHANAIGATRWVDHKIGQPGLTIEGAAAEIEAQGALFSVNHPALDVACIGCAWKHDLDPSKIAAVEIATWGLKEGSGLFSPAAIAFWDDLCAKGHHVAAVGGSDDHKAGVDEEQFQAPIGNPTTMVLADELSVSGILDAVRNGRTVVKLQDPSDPMVELTSEVAPAGDTVAARSTRLRAKVTGVTGADGVLSVRFVKNGQPDEAAAVAGEGFVHEIVVAAPDVGEDRYRAEVLVDERLRTLTSHVWLRLDPAGRDVASETTAEDGGCNASGSPRALGLVPIAALGALSLVVARRRRRSFDRQHPG